MRNEKRADYSERWLLPPALEDWVGADHPARFIRAFVDGLDMKALGFKMRETEEGAPSYAPDLLLKAWLYGYMQRIRSSRELERACRENMGLIWLTGRNEPDHNTLWRFWRDNNRALRKVFKQGVVIAARAKLIGMVVHAVDGTKIAAQASKRTGWHRGEMEKILKRIDASIDKAMKETEAAEGSETGEYRLSEELSDEKKLRETIKKALEEMEEAGTEHINPNEPEARMMKCDGVKRFGYNAQAVVDGQSGLIVAGDVVSDQSDNHLLVPMIKQVEENLKEVAQETVADGGYFAAEELWRAEQSGHSVLVRLRNQEGEYHTSRFYYDERKDCCVCPRGETLEFARTKLNRQRKHMLRVYQCRVFKTCPVRWECSSAADGRSIEISPYHGAVVRQRKKQQNPDKRDTLKRRMAIAEPVFAQIKQGMGFRRWTLRSTEGVKTQWSLLCTAFNLRKLHRLWIEGELATNF